MVTTTISSKPERMRLSAPRGLEFGKIDREARVIHGFAAITRGEALGHGAWIDDSFLRQVSKAGNLRAGGVKSRFTHPGLSGDGLGTLLGRATNFHKKGERVFADLQLVESASKSPNGDLAAYVLDLAEEAPDLFGASIVFSKDWEAMEKFESDNQEGGRFKSPDEDNAENFPHIRLGQLFAADIVDDPAANPDGFFSAFAPGSELASRAEQILLFAFGLTEKMPDELAAGPHPERARVFMQDFLQRHGLQVAQQGGNETWSEHIKLFSQQRILDLESGLKSLNHQFALLSKRFNLLHGGS